MMKSVFKFRYNNENVLLTAVESRDANVISRFPFSPSKAGTKMKISEMSL